MSYLDEADKFYPRNENSMDSIASITNKEFQDQNLF